MFYSQCLVSKKGPLRAIWVAAYCHKKLRKDQVSETDIPFSVDEIISNEVSVTYRVLGYLLLGVVRIYSKKVEYLYDDCNDILTRINTYALPAKCTALKQTMCAPYRSITLPDKFELDAFNLDIPDDLNGENVNTHHQIKHKETSNGAENESLTKYYHEEENLHFESSSDFYTPIDVLLFKPMDIDMVVRSSHTPTMLESSMERFQDAFPEQEVPDINMIYGTTPTMLEASTERFQDEFLEQEGPELNLNCGTTSTMLEESTENFQDEFPEQEGPDLNMNCGTTPSMLEASMERFQGDQLAQEGPEVEMNCGTEEPGVEINCGAEEPLDLGVKLDEVNSQNKRRKCLEITPPNPSKSHVFSHGDPVVSADNGSPDESKFPQDSGNVKPELLVVRTPAIVEKPQFSKKRTYVFDDKIVLSNEVIRQNLHDSSSIVVKRRKGPQTALDVWRACKFSNIHWDFSEPLIPCMSQLGDLFSRKKSRTPEPVEDLEGQKKLAEDKFKTPCKSSHSEAFLAKIITEHSVSVMSETPGKSSEQETFFDKQTNNHSAGVMSETPWKSSGQEVSVAKSTSNHSVAVMSETTCKSSEQEAFSAKIYSDQSVVVMPETEVMPETPCKSSEKEALVEKPNDDSALARSVRSPTTTESDRPMFSVANGGDEMPAFEAPDNCLNLVDEEVSYQEEDKGKQDGLSIRTRKVARYLYESVEKRKDAFSIGQALEGKTKKESARLFYEILVLKSRELVDVKQDAPYDDVLVMCTQQLKAIFSN